MDKKTFLKLSNFLLFLYLFSIQNIFADFSFKDEYIKYTSYLQLADIQGKKSLIFHSLSSEISDFNNPTGPWENQTFFSKTFSKNSKIQNSGIESFNSFNSTFAQGSNDGAIWQGRGFNSQISFGLKLNYSNLSIYINPLLWFTQNSNFEILPAVCSSGYGDYYGLFDRLQRYGDDFYSQGSFGESEIRYTIPNKITAAFSFENYILGSSTINPILMSNNAEGFPHIDLGSPGLIRTNFGSIDWRSVWGLLKESPFFNDDPSDDYGAVNSFSIAYSPIFLPNFTFGSNFLYYMPINEYKVYDIFNFPGFMVNKLVNLYNSVFNSIEEVPDQKDSAFSFNLEWFLPESGFKVYLEWARTDYNMDFLDYLENLDHTAAYTLGFNQLINFKNSDNNFWVLEGEISNTEMSSNYYGHSSPWYRHGWIGWKQGYVNNGQIFGAAMGPGSNSQYLNLSYYNSKGKYGLFFQRVRYDNDYFVNVLDYSVNNKEVDLTLGLDYLLLLNSWEFYGNVQLNYFLNRLYIIDNNELNFHGEIGIRYLL